MSTRSIVMTKTASGKYRGVYVHFDGYPSWRLPLLLKHYTTQESVDKLIALGGISVLKPFTDIPEGVEHSFDNPYPNITIAYARDRGEDFDILEGDTRDELVDEEWSYCFEDGEWFYTNGYSWLNAKEKVDEVLKPIGLSVDGVNHIATEDNINEFGRILDRGEHFEEIMNALRILNGNED